MRVPGFHVVSSVLPPARGTTHASQARLVALAAIVAFALSGRIAHADHSDAPAPGQADEFNVPNVDHPPVTRLQLGGFTVVLEQTRLADLAANIPSGSVRYGDDSYKLCYMVDGNGRSERLWIVSDDEFGLDEHVVTGVFAQVLDRDEEEAIDCPSLPAGNYPISLDHDVWLGLSRTELAGRYPLLPRPTASDAYFYNLRPAPQYGETFETASYLRVEFKGDRVVRLWASSITQD